MNKVQLTGQAITSTNYATDRLFDFSPRPMQEMAKRYLACGVSEVEIPQGVLDPFGRCAEVGIDREAVAEMKARLPKETKVIGTYLGPAQLGRDNKAYLAQQRRTIALLVENFPDMCYAMLHPAAPELKDPDCIREMVHTFAELAQMADREKKGFQLCFHNHFDTNAETADQVELCLEEIQKTNSPNLRWGPDTGHCHGMGSHYLEVFERYAHLIGDFFHIKARIAAFDKLHGGAKYRPDRDIWSNKAEIGTGLYSGFVCAADPEIETPFREVFRIVREKARPVSGIVRGAMEIDIPRQHPQLEILLSALYFKNVHGIEPALPFSNDVLVKRAFGVA